MAKISEHCIWQDEKEFILEVPLNSQNSRVYVNGSKNVAHDSCLFHQTNKQSRKVMVSACVNMQWCYKALFVKDEKLKVNSKTYQKHLQTRTSAWHWNHYEDFLKENLHKRFVKHIDGLLDPPALLDCNPHKYHLWDKMKIKVYGNMLKFFGKRIEEKDKERFDLKHQTILNIFEGPWNNLSLNSRRQREWAMHKNVVRLICKYSFVCNHNDFTTIWALSRMVQFTVKLCLIQCNFNYIII